jgi:hypothetical protein
VGDATPVVGSQTFVSLQIGNNGPAVASDVVVSHQLGDGLVIDSVDANLGSYDPATGIWTVGELANGGGGFVTIYVTVAETGAYTTQAAITASSRPDPNESNNTAELITLTPNFSADLSLFQAVGDATPVVGSQTFVSLQVGNNGPAVASDVVVSHQLGDGLVIDSVDANLGSYDPATGIWTVGELANGGGGFVTIYVTVAETGAYTTQAAITASSRPDPNESNNSTGLITLTPQDATPPVITAEVSGTAGTNGWYTSDVVVSWTVVDLESPIVSQDGCEAVTVTADTAGVTFTCSATSGGGSSSESVTIRRDATLPVASILTPANDAVYLLGAAVLADYQCTDALSGIDSCVGTVAAGAAIDTATVGPKSFAVSATDQAGNSANTTHNYTVEAPIPPVFATDDEAETDQGEAVVIAVLANDGGGAGALSVSAVTQGANGAVTTDGQTVTYTPEPTFFGTDSFTYTATDGLTSAVGTVTVTVNQVDASVPVITPTVTGTLGNEGWYISGVEVTWTVEDPESEIDSDAVAASGCM